MNGRDHIAGVDKMIGDRGEITIVCLAILFVVLTIGYGAAQVAMRQEACKSQRGVVCVLGEPITREPPPFPGEKEESPLEPLEPVFVR